MEFRNIPELEEFQPSSIVKKIPILTEQLISTLICIDNDKDTTPHIHKELDELQYIISGTGKITIGRSKLELNPGMLVLVPKSTSHFFSTSNGKLTVMSISGLPPDEVECVKRPIDQ